MEDDNDNIMKGLDMNMMSNLFKGKDGKMPDPLDMCRMAIKMGSAELLKSALENVNILVQGADLLAFTIEAAKDPVPMVEMLLAKGATLMTPPESIPQLSETYRRTPYLFQAIKRRDAKLVDFVMNKTGRKIDEEGVVCLSRKRRQLVTSNVLGATAYYGLTPVLKAFLKDKLVAIEHPATESPDKYLTAYGKKPLPYEREWVGYTPLMLACASSQSNLETVKLLLTSKADPTVTDANGNTLFHIAAAAGSSDILDYLVKSCDIDAFARNKAGDTALTICKKAKNVEGEKILGQVKDNAEEATGDLFAQLLAEEEKAKADAAKKREKKQRNKVNRIAKAEGKDVEEVAKDLKLAAERKAKDEQEQRRRDAEAEAEADRLAALERKQRAEETRRLKQELMAAERDAAIERQRHAIDERKRLQALQREAEAEQRRFAAERRERRNAEQPEKKERVKSVRRDRNDEKQVETEAEFPVETPAEEEEVDETPKPVEETPEEARIRQREERKEAMARRSSKSVRRQKPAGTDESNLLGGGDDENDDGMIFGLSGDLIAKTAGRHTKKKLAQIRKEEEEEALRTKERMRRLADERKAKKAEAMAATKAEERKRLEEDDARRAEERREKKRVADQKRRDRKKEKEAMEKAEAEAQAGTEAALLGQTPQGPPEVQTATEEKADGVAVAKKPKTDKKKKVADQAADEKESTATEPRTARGRTKKVTAGGDGENIPPTDNKQKVEKKEGDGETPAPKEKRRRGKKDAEEKPQMVYLPKAQKPQEEAKVAEPKAPPKKQPEKKAEPARAIEVTPVAAEEPPAPKVTKKKEKSAARKAEPVEKPTSVAVKPQAHDIPSLRQMVLAKDSEIMKLEIHLEKKDGKIDGQAKEIAALQKQLAENAKGDALKEQVGTLNATLTKHKALTRLQATQIVEFEEALWNANKAKEDAEDRLLGAPAGADTANRDLRAKNFQLRDLQKSLDKYQGKAKALAYLSKGQLSQLHEELTGTLGSVSAAMEEK